MPVSGFDHYNLRAPRDVLERLCVFYRDVVGLELGERPPFRRFGYWLYADGRAVLHLSLADDGEQRSTEAVTTFAHAAFNCTARHAFERHLERHGVDYHVARIPLTGQVQLFFRDPAGNGVELQFDGAEA